MLFYPFSIKKEKRKIVHLSAGPCYESPTHHHRHLHPPIWLLEFSVSAWESNLRHYQTSSPSHLLHSPHPHLLVHNASINIPGLIARHLRGSRCSGTAQDRSQRCSRPGGSLGCSINLLQSDCIKGPDVQSTPRCADMRPVQGTDACQ